MRNLNKNAKLPYYFLHIYFLFKMAITVLLFPFILSTILAYNLITSSVYASSLSNIRIILECRIADVFCNCYFKPFPTQSTGTLLKPLHTEFYIPGSRDLLACHGNV
jgi:hypothetical protein